MSELLLGCGASRVKNLFWDGRSEWAALTTLDINPDHKPDVVHDLGVFPLPFPDEAFDEIHAYECLEHVGTQGDYKFFFGQFSDFWRLLKPGGILFATVPLPSSVWAWGDPSHTRVIPRESLTFLHQPAYEQVGTTAMSDFRYLYRADFDIIHLRDAGDALEFALQAVKPSRCSCM